MDAEALKLVLAIRRAAAARGVLLHAMIYVVTAAGLYAARLDWQFFWPMLGWLFGLLVHAALAFAAARLAGSREDERMAQHALGSFGSPPH